MITEVFIAVDDGEVYRATLPPGEYVIGRDEDAEIKIDHPTVSRRHAKLIVEEDQVILTDLESGNGTVIEELPLRGPSSIYEGQTARLGEVRLRARQRVSAEVLPESNRHYRKGGVVAMGGMGAIHEARQPAMGRKVAMKVMLNDQTESGLRRFINEARITGMLEHPNIVPVHELGIDAEGRVFYTMKFVHGTTLAEVLAGLCLENRETAEKYPLSFLLTVFQKVCDAIAFAHSRGVHHRDLKPENVMIGDFGEVLVMDWGLSKETGFASDAEDIAQTVEMLVGGELKTMDGSVLGTPAYMSPEQARGEIDAIDERSDIYSLGVILHEILYLQPPVAGTDMNEIVQKVAHGVTDTMPERARLHLPGGKVPPSLDAVRRKALAHDPARRYQKVQDLQEDITAYQLGFATSAEGAGLGTHLALFIKRNKALSAAVAAALMLLGGSWVWFTGNLVQQRNLAKELQEKAEEALAKRLAAEQQSEQAKVEAETERQRAAAADTGRIEAEASAEEAQMSEQEKDRALQRSIQTNAQLARESSLGARRSLVDDRPREALEGTRQAVRLAPDELAYVVQRANFLQAAGRFGEAVEFYRRAQDLGADRAVAGRNLELSLELARVQGVESELKPQVVERLTRELHGQGRELEIVLLDAARQGGLTEAVSGQEENLPTALRAYTTQPGWRSERIYRTADGMTGVNLSDLKIGRLTGLRGHGVRELDVSGTDLASLEDMLGLGLRRLNLRGTRVEDLSPLAGKPLEELVCSEGVTDLAPLQGMPLKKLDLSSTQVADLSPLAGLPLEELRLDGSPVVNLEPLRGLPLKKLYLNGTGVTDFGVLSSLTDLEVLDLPPQASEVDFAALPNLREIFYRHIRPEPMGIAELTAITTLRTKLWERWGPVLAQLRLPDLGPDRIVVRDDSGTFDLDLRGTEITELAALRGMPIHRLYLDTRSKRLDLSPLAESRTLRHLLVAGAQVPLVGPVAKNRQLESITLSPDVFDVALLQSHPSLQRIGYRLDESGLFPVSTVQEFFAAPEESEKWAGDPPLVSFDFDNAADGTQGWTLLDGVQASPRAYWMADPVSEGGRGGGHLTFFEREGNSALAYFVASPLLAHSQRKSLYGGLLEFRLRVSEEEPNELRGRVEVILKSGADRLHHLSPVRARTEWRTIVVPLDFSGRWTVGPNGPEAPERQLRAVLARLDDILIKAEYTTGVPDERTDLDDVRLWDANAAPARREILRSERR